MVSYRWKICCEKFNTVWKNLEHCEVSKNFRLCSLENRLIHGNVWILLSDFHQTFEPAKKIFSVYCCGKFNERYTNVEPINKSKIHYEWLIVLFFMFRWILFHFQLRSIVVEIILNSCKLLFVHWLKIRIFSLNWLSVLVIIRLHLDLLERIIID